MGIEPWISKQFQLENVNNLDFGIINKKMNHFDKEQPVSLFPTISLIPGIVVTNLSCIGSIIKYPGFFGLDTFGSITKFLRLFDLDSFGFFLLTSLALKGQLISNGIFGVFKSNKKPTIFL